EALEGQFLAVVIEHVVEQRAVIRLVDVRGNLHRARRKPDLMALYRAAVVDLERDPAFLDGVRVVDRHAGKLQRELPALGARLLRLLEPRGEPGDLGCIDHPYYYRYTIRFSTRPSPSISVTTSSPLCTPTNPSGVPVRITSPGESVMNALRYSIRNGMEKI